MPGLVMQLEGSLREAQSLSRSFVPVFSWSLGSWRLSVGRRPFEPEDLAKHYDKKSDDWHATIDRHGFEDAYRGLIDKVLRQHRYRQNARDLRVLDAGIGTGAMSSALYNRLGRHFQLVGIDISPAMLRQAARHLSKLEIDLTLAQANLADLSYPDSTFDVVLVAHVLEHMADPQVAIAELYRVTKPGGILICCITRRSSVGAYIQLIWRTYQVDAPTALSWLRHCGLQSVRAIPLDKRSATRRFSIGYVGRKPVMSSELPNMRGEQI